MCLTTYGIFLRILEVLNAFLFVIDACSFKIVQIFGINVFCVSFLFYFRCTRRKPKTSNINSSCMSCLPVRPHGRTRLRLGSFSSNKIRSFTKICTEGTFWLKSDRNNRHSIREQRTFINTVLTNVTMVFIVTKVSSVSVVTLPLLSCYHWFCRYHGYHCSVIVVVTRVRQM